MSDSEKVPLMFQAQVMGRSQIQKLEDLKEKAKKLEVRKETLTQQAYDWVLQWQQACDKRNIPQFDLPIRARDCQFTWRMVTNSGQDTGVIRPVIGERGWAFFPGSSMKGAFLRACKQLCSSDEVLLFCGGQDEKGDLRPGRLRFHGGYPIDAHWLNNSLVDVVHPQEDWQTKSQDKQGAFVQISLYKPTFTFGISSSKPLTPSQWETVWLVWKTALDQGIGSRVSAGYGQLATYDGKIATHNSSKLVSFCLSGQGAASKLINGSGEFRPNIFKAALRGHTQRLFNGITDESTANRLTKTLWGGFGEGEDKNAIVGLLGVAFNANDSDLELKKWRSSTNLKNVVPVYDIKDATLTILSVHNNLTLEQKKELKDFTIRLMKFAMLIGGFGKSWRRSDHRKFYPSYKDQMIGCHWEFAMHSEALYIPFEDDLIEITKFLTSFHLSGKKFSWLQKLPKSSNPIISIREAWCKANVQVWGRLAKNENDSLAIRWLHDRYNSDCSIKETYLTGWSSINERNPKTMIGRLWHRMYPQFCKTINDLGVPVWQFTGKYAELITMFPNVIENDSEQEKINNFLEFLKKDTDFQHLW
jgi:CRISPR-associated protein Cmr6